MKFKKFNKKGTDLDIFISIFTFITIILFLSSITGLIVSNADIETPDNNWESFKAIVEAVTTFSIFNLPTPLTYLFIIIPLISMYLSVKLIIGLFKG